MHYDLAVEYKRELFDQVCVRLASGMTLEQACGEPGFPRPVTVYSWLRKDPELQRQYEIAQGDRAKVLADEILEIADDGRNDWMQTNDPENPGWLANHEHINRSRLRVDTRKWLASKMLPKVYGDAEVGKGVVAVQVNVVTGVPEPSTP